MKILIAHNFYQQPGGEDIVVERETALLREAGHEIIEYHRSNSEFDALNWLEKAALPKRMIWAGDTVKDLRAVIAEQKPDIAHFHNTHFMISPSGYLACREMNIPVIQSLHNPRLMCLAASFYREGRLCQDCLGKTPPWPGVLHGCYGHSRIKSAVLATYLSVHRWLRTWATAIDKFICFTEFYKEQYILGDLPAEKIEVKPHFVEPDPGERPHGTEGDYALFIGRLDPEKGVQTLLQAWQHLDIPLKIRGAGQLYELVLAAAEKNSAIEVVGPLARTELDALIKQARFLIWPSEGYYETFGLVAVEAFANGVPVIASRIGVMSEIVKHNDTGLHFRPGDVIDLRAKAEWAWSYPQAMVKMGRRARQEFEEKFTAARNYEQLMAIYERCLS